MLKPKPKIKLQNNLLIITGLILISVFGLYRFHQARILSFNTKTLAQIVSTTGVKPVYIKIYPIGVDVAIKEAVINNGVWTIFDNAAGHLATSVGIGDKGNMVIYGHNKDSIFGPIRWIKIGARIEILGSDKKTYCYQVIKMDTVSPNDLEYVLPKDKETLTLYTCTGFLDSQRFVVVAEPAS